MYFRLSISNVSEADFWKLPSKFCREPTNRNSKKNGNDRAYQLVIKGDCDNKIGGASKE